MRTLMNWAAIAAAAMKRAGQLAAALALYWALRQSGLYEIARPETEGLNTLILLIGNIYAVLFAFVIFVIWTQFTEVENFAMRECNSLNDLLRFSGALNADAAHGIRRAVVDYARKVPKSEWPALAERRRDKQTEKLFTDPMEVALRTQAGDEAIHARLVDAARKCAQHRDERIAKSLTRIPPTLERLVNGMAGVPLLLVYVYPFRSPAAGAACFTVLAVVLSLANLVM